MDRSSRNDRIKAAICTVMLEGLIAYALLIGLRIAPVPRPEEAITLLALAPPERPPAPPVPPPRSAPPRTKAPEGAASPANLRSRATEIVAPPPVLPLPPTPLIAARDPDMGSDPSSGSADRPGPGTGSGGIGDGTGSGRGGFGPGGGGGGGTPPRRISGRLRDSDYPRWAWAAGIGGRVEVIFSIETDGRVGACDIVDSSGSDDLDDMTCRLIRERYRFRPKLDREGRPTRSRMIENHNWVVEIEPRER